MKVIVAGYPKTGTKTMVAALEQLGYTVFDYMENYEFLGDDWVQIMKNGVKEGDFRRMFSNVDACTDMPCCFYWEEILREFPDAKVILTVRDDEEVWLNSFRGQMKAVRSPIYLVSLFLSKTSRHLSKYGGRVYQTLFHTDNVFDTWFPKSLINDQLCVKSYKKHNMYVKQTAPTDQLLVFNVKEGWKPLCNFLDKPVPYYEFPRKNIKAKVVEDLKSHKVFKKIQLEFCLTGLVVIVLLLIAFIWCINQSLNLVLKF